ARDRGAADAAREIGPLRPDSDERRDARSRHPHRRCGVETVLRALRSVPRAVARGPRPESMTLAVGQKARRTLTLSAEHVAAYARLTGDYNPLHFDAAFAAKTKFRSEEHTSELQSRENLVCRLLLE